MGPRRAKAACTVPLSLVRGLSPQTTSAPAPLRPAEPSRRPTSPTSIQTAARVPLRGAAPVLSVLSTPRVPLRGAALSLWRALNSRPAKRSATGTQCPKPLVRHTKPTVRLITPSRCRRRRREPRSQVILRLPRRARRYAASRTCTLPGARITAVATAVPMTLASHPAVRARHQRASRSLPPRRRHCHLRSPHRWPGVRPWHPPWSAAPRLAPRRSPHRWPGVRPWHPPWSAAPRLAPRRRLRRCRSQLPPLRLPTLRMTTSSARSGRAGTVRCARATERQVAVSPVAFLLLSLAIRHRTTPHRLPTPSRPTTPCRPSTPPHLPTLRRQATPRRSTTPLGIHGGTVSELRRLRHLLSCTAWGHLRVIALAYTSRWVAHPAPRAGASSSRRAVPPASRAPSSARCGRGCCCLSSLLSAFRGDGQIRST